MIKKIGLFIILILLVSGCKNFHVKEKGTIERVISLAPSATEIIYALGKDKKLIGVTKDCNYPPLVKNKVKIGSFGYPDLEKIISLKPDLVVANYSSKHPIVKRLKKLKIKVINLENSNIKSLFKNIFIIGDQLNASKRAAMLVNKIKLDIDKIRKTAIDKKLKVFVEIWGKPLFTAGGNSYIGELIELAGGKNITGYLKENYPQISEEIVLKENPRIIILAYKGRQKVLNRKKWKHIDAVQLGQVYDNFDFDVLQRPGPRIVKALNEISDILRQSK